MRDEEGLEVVKILDFGISKVLTGEQRELTSKGLLMGTPIYMAPEQARGVAVDPRADLYAVGAILYRAVVGEPAHDADTLGALIAAKLENKIVPASQRNPELSESLDRVLATAMATDPGDRFADARAFRRALAGALGHSSSAAHVPVVRAAAPRAPAAPAQGARAPAPSARPAAGKSPAGKPTGGSVDRSLDQIDLGSLVALDDREGDAPAAALDDRPVSPDDPTLPPAGASQSRSGSAPKPPAQPSAPKRAAVSADAFAPPGADDRDLQLDLAVSSPRPSREEPPPSEPELEEQHSPELHSALRAGQARKRPAGRLTPLLALAGLLVVGGGGYLLLSGDSVEEKPAGPAQPQQVKITINVKPRWAEVRVDGVVQSTQPLWLQRSNREHRITVRATGYRSEALVITPERDLTIPVELHKVAVDKAPEPEPEARKKKKRRRSRRKKRRKKR